MFVTGFHGGVGLTEKLCCPWTSGCTNWGHWAIRTPWLCPCCWSWYHDLTILWISFKDLLHIFVHGSQSPRAADEKYQGPARGVDHRKVTQQLMLSFSQMQSQFQSQMQSQGLALSPEPEFGPSATRVCTKKSCVDPSGNDPDAGESKKCGLYVIENPPHLVVIGRLYEGSTTIHNIPLAFLYPLKVGVEEVQDADACILVPTQEVQLVGQALNTFVAWPTNLVKCLLEQTFHCH